MTAAVARRQRRKPPEAYAADPPKLKREKLSFVRDFKGREEWRNAARRDKALSDAEKVAADALASFFNIRTGQCNPAVETLANSMGKSETSARKYVRALKEKGWVSFETNPGGARKSHEYRLLNGSI